MQITTIVTGGLAIVLGLNLLWAIIAIIIGNLLGGIFMALHSAQGPKLGIPQMIQSRAQFGIIGAILPLILVVLMYIGFFASTGVLGAEALSSLLHLPFTIAAIITNLLTYVLVLYGYDMIHRFRDEHCISSDQFCFWTIFPRALHCGNMANHLCTVCR